MSPHVWIYVTGRDERGCIKIGITGDLDRRLQGLWINKYLPRWTNFWGPFKRSVGYKVEKAAQASLEQKSAGEEWFHVERDTAIKAVERAAEKLGVSLGEQFFDKNPAARVQDDAAEMTKLMEWWEKIMNGTETAPPADRPEWQRYIDRQREIDARKP